MEVMDLDAAACYRALCTRDARFDGRLFVGVRTTGIYCRPVCPARAPKFENCRFYPSAAAAQEAGFRPCLRCRPEIAPDLAFWRGTANTVSRALALIADGALDEGEAGVEEPSPGEDLLLDMRKAPALRRPDGNAAKFGIRVEGVADVPLRLAKCCRPVSGDPILGYVSLGRGITIHRDDCPNVAALRKDPERFVPVSWDGDNETGFKVEIQLDAWDRHRLLEDLSRTFAEAGINIVEARCLVQHPMTRNRFVIEVGDTQALKSAINRLRAIDSVFDAYRVIPAGG